MTEYQAMSIGGRFDYRNADQIVYRACVHGCEAFQQSYIGLVSPSFIVGESRLRQAEHFAGLFQCPSSQFALGT